MRGEAYSSYVISQNHRNVLLDVYLHIIFQPFFLFFYNFISVPERIWYCISYIFLCCCIFLIIRYISHNFLFFRRGIHQHIFYSEENVILRHHITFTWSSSRHSLQWLILYLTNFLLQIDFTQYSAHYRTSVFFKAEPFLQLWKSFPSCRDSFNILTY